MMSGGFGGMPPITGGHAGPATSGTDFSGSTVNTQASSFAVGGNASAESNADPSGSGGRGADSMLVYVALGVAALAVVLAVVAR